MPRGSENRKNEQNKINIHVWAFNTGVKQTSATIVKIIIMIIRIIIASKKIQTSKCKKKKPI